MSLFSAAALSFTSCSASDIEVDRIECSDTCVPLIELWQVIRDDPEGLVRRYKDVSHFHRGNHPDLIGDR